MTTSDDTTRRAADRRSTRLALLLLPASIAAATALVLSALDDPVYEATSTVAVGARVVVGTDEGPAASLGVEEELAESDIVRDAVQAELGLEQPPPAANARPLADASGLEITVRSSDASTAALLANAYAAIYVEVRTEQVRATLEEFSADVEARVDELRAALDESAQESSEPLPTADELLSRLIDDTIVSVGATVVVEPASVPTDAVEPRPVRNVLVAAAGGLLVGLLGILILDYRDHALLSARDVDRKAGLAVFGTVPAVDPDSGVPDLSESDRQRYAEVLGAVLSRQPGMKVLQLVAGDRTDQTPVVASALAIVAAEAGYRVALVDTDFADPTLDGIFEPQSELGVSDVVAGAEPADVVTTVDGLVLYTAGSAPGTPAEILLRPRFARLLGAMGSHYELVILVGPSVVDEGGTTVSASLVDATVLTVQSGASAQRVGRVTDSLREAGGRVAGAVFVEGPALDDPLPGSDEPDSGADDPSFADGDVELVAESEFEPGWPEGSGDGGGEPDGRPPAPGDGDPTVSDER